MQPINKAILANDAALRNETGAMYALAGLFYARMANSLILGCERC
jgi:hypothetical protein